MGRKERNRGRKEENVKEDCQKRDLLNNPHPSPQ